MRREGGVCCRSLLVPELERRCWGWVGVQAVPWTPTPATPHCCLGLCHPAAWVAGAFCPNPALPGLGSPRDPPLVFVPQLPAALAAGSREPPAFPQRRAASCGGGSAAFAGTPGSPAGAGRALPASPGCEEVTPFPRRRCWVAAAQRSVGAACPPPYPGTVFPGEPWAAPPRAAGSPGWVGSLSLLLPQLAGVALPSPGSARHGRLAPLTPRLLSPQTRAARTSPSPWWPKGWPPAGKGSAPTSTYVAAVPRRPGEPGSPTPAVVQPGTEPFGPGGALAGHPARLQGSPRCLGSTGVGLPAPSPSGALALRW